MNKLSISKRKRKGDRYMTTIKMLSFAILPSAQMLVDISLKLYRLIFPVTLACLLWDATLLLPSQLVPVPWHLTFSTYLHWTLYGKVKKF